MLAYQSNAAFRRIYSIETMKSPSLSFSHVGIHVHDPVAMEAFYTGTLGFFVTDRGRLELPKGPVQLVFLSRNPDEHHQIVLATGRPAELAFNVVNQLSMRVDSLGGLKIMHERLRAQGNPDIHCVTHGNALSVYAPDPEGNRVELFVDTPWYVTQPMRVPVDLSLPDEQIMSQAEAHARSLPGFRPRAQWRAEMARLMGMD